MVIPLETHITAADYLTRTTWTCSRSLARTIPQRNMPSPAQRCLRKSCLPGRKSLPSTRVSPARIRLFPDISTCRWCPVSVPTLNRATTPWFPWRATSTGLSLIAGMATKSQHNQLIFGNHLSQVWKSIMIFKVFRQIGISVVVQLLAAF